MFTVEKNILHLMNIIIANRIKGVANQKEFCQSIGISSGNIKNIKDGKRGFTTKQIKLLIDHYGVNANYIFGTDTQAFMPNRSEDIVQTIRNNMSQLVADIDNLLDTTQKYS